MSMQVDRKGSHGRYQQQLGLLPLLVQASTAAVILPAKQVTEEASGCDRSRQGVVALREQPRIRVPYSCRCSVWGKPSERGFQERITGSLLCSFEPKFPVSVPSGPVQDEEAFANLV